ncbi:hypothetical protein ACFXPS_43390 [Nocardia sp. NPDC059091]|uniref:hypothetical protein n=1 Tax=unclassified Nocardia TaxID=2637762 RepID=UPI0036AF26F1
MLFGIVGCSLSGSSVHFTQPSKYDAATLCSRYESFLHGLGMVDARTDGPGGDTEPGGIVGWSTICGSFHDGKDRIGMLQAVNDRIDDGPLDVDTDYRPVAGFEDKARVAVPELGRGPCL